MRKLTHEEIARSRYTIDQLEKENRYPIYGLLDNIRSLYNVGSIFRSADGARIAKLFLCGYTPHPPRKEIDKTALGATKTVPWEYHKDPLSLLKHIKSQCIQICLLEHTDKSIPYYELSKDNFPICLIVGNEITGISKEIIEQADLSVEIPMYGMKQSLNAAVAFGITVFDFVRTWNVSRTKHRFNK